LTAFAYPSTISPINPFNAHAHIGHFNRAHTGESFHPKQKALIIIAKIYGNQFARQFREISPIQEDALHYDHQHHLGSTP
jgi:hypothetical protein